MNILIEFKYYCLNIFFIKNFGTKRSDLKIVLLLYF